MRRDNDARPISTLAPSIFMPMFLPAALASAGVGDGLMEATSNVGGGAGCANDANRVSAAEAAILRKRLNIPVCQLVYSVTRGESSVGRRTGDGDASAQVRSFDEAYFRASRSGRSRRAVSVELPAARRSSPLRSESAE